MEQKHSQHPGNRNTQYNIIYKIRYGQAFDKYNHYDNTVI